MITSVVFLSGPGVHNVKPTERCGVTATQPARHQASGQRPHEPIPPKMEPIAAGCHVVAIPYPGRGHINPMLILARLLAARGVAVTFVVTEEWLGFLASGPPPPPGVRLRSIPNVIPSEIGRAADFTGFLKAVYTRMEAPAERLLDCLEPPPVAIVADTYLPWAVAVGERRSIPVHSLFTMSASFFSVLYHFDLLPGAADGCLPVAAPEAYEPLGRYIPGHNSMQLADFRSIASMTKPRELALEAFYWVRRAQCVLFTSFYELESPVIDALRAKLPCPVLPLGPSVPHLILHEKAPNTNGDIHTADYFKWLDLQPKSSVLYVSLGSFLSVSASQMDEIAMGLNLSGARVLWVARGDSSRVRELVGDAGQVVSWCEQLRVLCHPSVGGFLTHCGWNSTLEGVFAGVPMLAFPIFWDQPVDSRLIVDEWKVGLRLKEVGEEGIVGREEIARAVKRLMDLEGIEGREMRRRVAELQDSACQAIEVGGSSYENLSSLVETIMQR